MPAGLLLVVIVLAGTKAGLGFWVVTVLAAGIVILPGLVYKKFAVIARRFGLPSNGRTVAVTTLTIAGALACVLLSVPAPVPATVLGLAAGNGLLALARRWMNASAHVSVTTFAVLWVTDVFGSVFIWLLVLSPMMMLSRTALREDSWREAVALTLLGIVTYGCFFGS